MTALTLVPTNTALETAAMTWPEKATAMRVVDQTSHDEAGAALVALASLEKQIIAHHAEPKQKAFEAHKAIVAAEKRLLEPLQQARRITSSKITTWESEQRRIQQELQRRAQEESDRLAREAALAAAVQAEEAGAPEEAVTQILESPPVVVAPVVAPTFQKATGIAATERWHAAVTSLKMLCQAVIDGKIPETAVEANMVWLNARARSDKEHFNVPGAKAVKEIGTRVNTR
jgi:hypothetical protein